MGSARETTQRPSGAKADRSNRPAAPRPPEHAPRRQPAPESAFSGKGGAAAPERQAAAPKPAAPAPARPSEAVDLRGNPTFATPAGTREWLAAQPDGRGTLDVRYGALAAGAVDARAKGDHVVVEQQGIPISHPWLGQLAAALGKAGPCLVFRADGGRVTGWVGFDANDERAAFVNELLQHAEALGLPGFQIPSLPKSPFVLAGGTLSLELKDVPVRLGNALRGQFTVRLGDDGAVDFEGNVAVSVPGLANGEMRLERGPTGAVVGTVDLAVNVNENLSGDVHVEWDGHALRGEGKVAYAGEKLSGSVTLRVGDRGAAEAGAGAGGAEPGANSAAPEAPRAGEAPAGDLVLSGEGELDVHFTDWLSGKAQVSVDEQGHATVVGEIRPQAEVELFPQQTWRTHLFRVEARAGYGIPLLGNVFVFAGIGLDATAMIGPAKLHDIAVAGTYSTDPDQAKDFRIEGALNVSGAAGLVLRGDAGVGLQLLGHDVKAGAGIDAFAGVRGYAEARPTIGYRENGEKGQDNKGEFYLQGQFELAAQPVLALEGELFIEVDAPWWSPVPDKRWSWPLGGLEYPLAGSLGMLATIDYVIGSNELPKIECHPAEFSADKFLSDLFAQNTPRASGDKGEKEGAWKDGAAQGTGTPATGEPGEAPHPERHAKGNGGNLAVSGVDPKLAEAQKRKDAAGTGGPEKATGTKTPESPDGPEHDKKVADAVREMADAAARFDEDGATRADVEKSAAAIKARHGVLKSLAVDEKGGFLDFVYEASEKKRVHAAHPKEKEPEARRGPYEGTPDPRWKTRGPKKSFTRTQKRVIFEKNRANHGGKLMEDRGSPPRELEPPRKHVSGETPPETEAQVDHIFPRSKGGWNTYGNAEVLSRTANRAKSDTVEGESEDST